MNQAEEERTRLIEAIHSLELKLKSLEQQSTEEQWTMRQQRNSLDAERASFERERDFLREKMSAEEKRIEVRTNILRMKKREEKT